VDSKRVLRGLHSRFGVYVIALYYLFLVALIFVIVRENFARDLLHLIHDTQFLVQYLLLNPIVLYLLSTFFEKLVRLEHLRKGPADPVGIYLATAYLFLVVIVFVFTRTTTKPGNVGYDWIPFIMLAVPWYFVNPRFFLLPGFVVNAGLLYLFGMACNKLRHRTSKIDRFSTR